MSVITDTETQSVLKPFRKISFRESSENRDIFLLLLPFFLLFHAKIHFICSRLIESSVDITLNI